jgi:LytS/YehU family sensor histidine kinase
MGSGIHSYDLHENIIPIKLNLTYTWLVNLLFHLLNGIIYYVREYKTMQIKTATLQKLNREAELQIVRQQLNPHFLFNNLNVLSSLIMQNQPDANKFIEEFSNLYRYILSCPEKDLVQLDAEIRHIESYVFLLKKRFDKAIEFKFDLLPPSGGVHIVPASLQLLIENAIKHNTVSQSKPLMIRISQPNETQIEVCNNLQSRISPNNGKGVGLQHIQMRYQMVTNKPVEIISEDGFFTVRIPLINSKKIFDNEITYSGR